VRIWFGTTTERSSSCAVGEILVELLVALGPGAFVADRNLVAFRDRAAVLADIGADTKDLVGDIDPVRNRTFVRVLRDEVAAEKPHCVQRRRCGQADDKGVAIFEHLAPRAIDRPMAFIGDDQVEALDRDRRVVMHDPLRLASAGLESRFLLVSSDDSGPVSIE
jgi:hypothetical protein